MDALCRDRAAPWGSARSPVGRCRPQRTAACGSCSRFSALGVSCGSKSPKTDTSRRRIVVPSFCIDALRRHHSSERVKLASLGLPMDPTRLVFTSQAGTPIEPRNVNRAFEALLKKAKLRRVKLHDLRHTCASLLFAEGVAPRVVMELLGHSAIAVTMNTYSHVIPALQDESAQRMDALFRP